MSCCDIAQKSASQHDLTCCIISFLCTSLAHAVSRPYLWDCLDNLPEIQVRQQWEWRTWFRSAFHQSQGKRWPAVPSHQATTTFMRVKRYKKKSLDLIITQHFTFNSEKRSRWVTRTFEVQLVLFGRGCITCNCKVPRWSSGLESGFVISQFFITWIV